MVSKAEARELRKLESQGRLEASKRALIERVTLGQGPFLQGLPQSDAKPRIASNLNSATEQSPKSIVSGSCFGSRVTWCISKADRDGQWTWGEMRNWTEAEWADPINPKMQDFSSKTWQEIDQEGSGTGHKMHHSHSITDLPKEVQDRWLELDLEQFDTLFRFRLSGKRRVWGFRLQAHFHFVWWDREHRIYPV